MEIVGKIVEFTPIETGTSANGTWSKRYVVIETLDQNQTKVAFSAMNAKLEEVNKHTLNEVVRVRFGLSSRKVEQRWFSEIQLWGIQNV